jgi:transposase
MMIIGCDLHTRYQQIAMLDTDTGELVERRLEHESGEARAFYATLSGAVRVGIEATGHTHWFEAMLAELGHELWMGDAAKIRASVVRKQKTDARDAAHLLELLRQDRFPKTGVRRRGSGICGNWSGTGRS